MKNLVFTSAIFFVSSFTILAQLDNNPNSGENGLRTNGNLNGNNMQHIDNDINNNCHHYKRAMSNSDFSNVKKQLVFSGFDHHKVQYAKQITDQTYWSAQQVKEIVQMIVFEDMRLDFAKYAYPKTIDTHNYYLVKEIIFQPQNKSNLDNYIQSETFRNQF